MRKKLFFTKVMQMTASFIIFNVSGLLYNIYISHKIGSMGIGIFHLVMNVYSMGISFSVSGMNLTCTRLLSEKPLNQGYAESVHIIKKCVTLCLATSFVSALIMFIGADFISVFLIGNPDCAMGIRILSPGLFCVGISGVIGGYFTAFAKVKECFLSQLLCEISSWAITLFIVDRFSPDKMFLAVIISTSASVFIRLASDIFMFLLSVRCHIQKKGDTKFSGVLRLCTPLALGSYLRTGLSGLENFLIPKRLSRGGDGKSIETYGKIKGMSMGIILFPSVFINAFSSLLIPEIARRHFGGQKKSLAYISSLSLEYTLKFSFLISSILYFWGYDISSFFYPEKNVGQYITLLSFLPLLMFSDSVCDSILKGLDEQVFTLKLNAIDSILRNLSIFFILPILKEKGYILILYASEFFNLSLSFFRMKKRTAMQFPLGKAVLFPVISIFFGRFIVSYLPHLPPLFEMLIFSGTYVAVSEFMSVHKKVI
ncbi:MAG: hypothetical protein E7394_00210 [Ruminococcaceae bacterium]|nr:hypothetical protein [Oscillospiraceae bacterium]